MSRENRDGVPTMALLQRETGLITIMIGGPESAKFAGNMLNLF